MGFGICKSLHPDELRNEPASRIPFQLKLCLRGIGHALHTLISDKTNLNVRPFDRIIPRDGNLNGDSRTFSITTHAESAETEITAVKGSNDFTRIRRGQRGDGAEEGTLAIGKQSGGFTTGGGESVKFGHEQHIATAAKGVVVFDKKAPAAAAGAQDVIPQLVEVQVRSVG